MKQSAFSRPPCRLIWYALVPLSLIFAFCFFLNGAIADEEPSLWETAVVSNPNPQDRLNLREQPSEAAASLGKYYNGVVVQIDQNLQNGWVHVTIGNGEGIAQGYMSTQYLAFGQDAQTVASAIRAAYKSSCWVSLTNGGICVLVIARDTFGIILQRSNSYLATIMTAIG